MSLGPDVNQTVLLPLLVEFRDSALRRRQERVQPAEAQQVWAYMTRGEGDGEFVVGIDGHALIDTDRHLVELALPLMEEIARQTGWTIRLVRFDRRGTSIATIGGGR